MAGYKLLSYEDAGTARGGVLVDGRVHDLASVLGEGAGAPVSVLSALENWDRSRAAIQRAVSDIDPASGRALADTKLLAPILYPGTLLCAGANYYDHAKEMARRLQKIDDPVIEKPADPWFFVKTTGQSIIGPGEAIRLPSFSKMVDWEAEIGLVVGRTAKELTPANALDCLAGYTIVNDLSARDFIKREGSSFVFDWVGQKCFDTAAPMGPWITPADEITDVSDMAIRLWVNDELKQESSTAQIIHDFVEQLVYLSHRMTLRPGDVVATGTPAGVGMPDNTFLAPGDTVRIEIAGLGELVNPVIAG